MREEKREWWGAERGREQREDESGEGEWEREDLIGVVRREQSDCRDHDGGEKRECYTSFEREREEKVWVEWKSVKWGERGGGRAVWGERGDGGVSGDKRGERRMEERRGERRSTTKPTIIQLRNFPITHSTSTSRFAKKRRSQENKIKKGKNVVDEPQEPVAAGRWLPVEEELLATCYVAVSEDNNVGRSQKHETFWYRVLNEFNSENFQKRTKDRLTSKWHTLNANCQKFNAAYKRAKRLGKSGENDVDLMKRAQSIYRDEHKGVSFTQEDA
ncbi:hypothetical protein Tco_0565584 [Tanacetum coccineum]